MHAPNIGGLPARLKGSKWHQLEPLEHYYYFTARTLQGLLRKAKLEVIGRFNLTVSAGWLGKLQNVLGGFGIYVDSGLGVVARRSSGAS